MNRYFVNCFMQNPKARYYPGAVCNIVGFVGDSTYFGKVRYHYPKIRKDKDENWLEIIFALPNLWATCDTNPGLKFHHFGHAHPSPSFLPTNPGNIQQPTFNAQCLGTRRPALTAAGTHMGNTLGIDMGNTFHFNLGLFFGHDVEKGGWRNAAASVCETGREGPKKHGGSVPGIRLESPGRYTSGRSVSNAMDCAGSEMARGGPSVVRDKFLRSGCGGFDDCGGATGVGAAGNWRRGCAAGASRPKCSSARTIGKWLKRLGLNRHSRRRTRRGPPVKRPPLTMAQAEQPCVDGGFKGWFRTQDGRRVEPLTVRDLFSRKVLTIRLLKDQSWKPVQREFGRLFGLNGYPKVIRADNGHPFGSTGPMGLSSLSALVDGPRDTRRIYCSGASRTEWRARTDAPGVQGRDDAAALASSPGTATAYGSLDQNLQSGPTASGVGPADASRNLLPTTGKSPATQGGLSKALGSTTGAQQWTNQMAWPKAICGRSSCRIPGRAETWHWRQGAGLFCRAVGRRVVAVRPRRMRPITYVRGGSRSGRARRRQSVEAAATRAQRLGVHAAPARFARLRSVNTKTLPIFAHNHAVREFEKCYPCVCSKCYPCVCPLPTPALSRAHGRGKLLPRLGDWPVLNLHRFGGPNARMLRGILSPLRGEGGARESEWCNCKLQIMLICRGLTSTATISLNKKTGNLRCRLV